MHRGSHRGYTYHAIDALQTAQDALEARYGGLDKVPPEVLVQTMKALEKQLRDDITRIADLRSPSGRLQ